MELEEKYFFLNWIIFFLRKKQKKTLEIEERNERIINNTVNSFSSSTILNWFILMNFNMMVNLFHEMKEKSKFFFVLFAHHSP